MNIDPREFDLQERALREDAGWRDVAAALRRSPGEPPAEFAASMATLVEDASRTPVAAAASAGEREGEGRIERWLLRALVAVLGMAGVGAVALYGREWFGSLPGGFDAIASAMGGGSAINWASAAGACMALSWVFAQGAPRLGEGRR